jgi:hypothetical protein
VMTCHTLPHRDLASEIMQENGGEEGRGEEPRRSENECGNEEQIKFGSLDLNGIRSVFSR